MRRISRVGGEDYSVRRYADVLLLKLLAWLVGFIFVLVEAECNEL